MTESVEDLAAWLTAVWDEEADVALVAAGWDRSGRKRASGQWVRTGVSSVEDDEHRSVIYSDSGQVSGSVADHVARNDPASVLARIAADRSILDLHGVAWNAEVCTVCHHPHGDGETLDNDAWPCLTVRLLASPYADREGFRPEWLVERQGVEQ